MLSHLLRFLPDNLFVTGDPRGRPFTRQQFDRLRPRLRDILDAFPARRARGELGFMALHEDGETLDAILAYAKANAHRYDDLVVLGIGGSALGTKAIHQALDDLHANLLPTPQTGHPRLFVADNVDPALILSIGRLINPARTLLVVISKSGATLETMAAFLYFKDMLEQAHGADWNRHVVAITDPEGGYMRELVRRERWDSFPVPPNVGGRFSVFSAVGLFPLGMVGVPVSRLLEGQRVALEALAGMREDHPAVQFAAYGYLAQVEAGRSQIVFMPYADHLRETAFWFRQLWAESLGKALTREGGEARVGTTPVFASGATDQHSQVQLYIEGPADKMITFLEVQKPQEDAVVKGASGSFQPLAYLNGRTLHELLNLSLNATRDALSDAGKPNCTFLLPELTPESLGALYASLMIATAIAGDLYGIDAFDQPGVEHGKKKIKKALGLG